MINKTIYILGVGHNTEVYIDLVETCGFGMVRLLHYNDELIGEELYGKPIIDSTTNFFKKKSLAGMLFAISVGDNEIRTKLANQIREKAGVIPTLIHPSAIVSKYARIDEGVVIHANSVIQAGVSINSDSVISYNVSVTHNSAISKACYIAAGANIGAYIKIYNNVLVGQSATIISGKVDYIGENSIIGAGSVVTKNVEPNFVVAGNPARFINLNKKE